MNIVITGASKGIGFAIAQQFAAHGHDLYLTSKTAADLEKAATDLRAQFPLVNIECGCFFKMVFTKNTSGYFNQ